jgi:hypothetical protein
MSSPIVLGIAAKCALLAPRLDAVALKKLVLAATDASSAWAGETASAAS